MFSLSVSVISLLATSVVETQSASLPRDDIIIRSDGLVVKKKEDMMVDQLSALTRMSEELENSYRSVNSVTDFSKVVVGMMDSLKDLELKGDEMVKKISVQESRLSSLGEEINAKEEYITVVNEKVKESEAVFNDIQDRVKISEERNKIIQDDTDRKGNKIKAQEVRLKRLVKDITTKVEYVNVVDNKINEIENKLDTTTKQLEDVKNEKIGLESSVKQFETRAKFAKQQIENFNKEMLEKENLHRTTINQHKADIVKYSGELSRIKEELPTYREQIEKANNTLSNLEKATKELEPEEELISPQILYPVFAASLIGNLVMGGHILSQVPSTLKQSLNLGGGASETISKTIQEGKASFEDEEEEEDNYPQYDNYISQYEGYDGYEGYDPLKKLEILQREKADTLTKQSDYDFLRRSNFPELAYSY